MPFKLNESEVISRLENFGDYFLHTISDHPVLQMERLSKLLKRIPKVFYSAGIKPESAIIGDGDTYPGQHPLDYALDHMGNANAYLYAIGIECDDEIKPLYRELKAGLDEFCRRNGYRLTDVQLALFISSPGAISPHHMDHQHTFLAQIKGRKTVYQWPAQNFDVTTPQELEIFLARVTRELKLKEEGERFRTPYELSPGKGVYIPFLAPHTVTNGDEVSISLSIIFNTEYTQKIQNIYRANHFLRTRCHLSPTLPGESAWKDEVKNQYFKAYDASVVAFAIPGRAVRKLKRILHGTDKRISASN